MAKNKEPKTEKLEVSSASETLSLYVFKSSVRIVKNGMRTQYQPGDPVVGFSGHDIIHFLSNGFIEQRKG